MYEKPNIFVVRVVLFQENFLLFTLKYIVFGRKSYSSKPLIERRRESEGSRKPISHVSTLTYNTMIACCGRLHVNALKKVKCKTVSSGCCLYVAMSNDHTLVLLVPSVLPSRITGLFIVFFQCSSVFTRTTLC